jgi:RNA polymerase sigma factor (sigma-70 family)
MTELDALAARFEASRPRLRAVAYRMLGSAAEADDAVQEAWLHVSRTQADGVENLNGWLTTVVARVCLDMLRSRKSRREEPLETRPGQLAGAPGLAATGLDNTGLAGGGLAGTGLGGTGLAGTGAGLDGAGPPSPESEALLADSVGLAMLVVLDRLAPAERVAFVLHDMFDLPFDEIAGITGRSAVAARQLASRARRRVRGTPAPPGGGQARQRQLVTAFLAASRAGDFEALLAVLDPQVELHADPAAAPPGSPLVVTGAAEVASRAPDFRGRARFARLALVDGQVAIVVGRGSRLWTVLCFAFGDGRITRIDVVADPGRLARLRLTVLDD